MIVHIGTFGECNKDHHFSLVVVRLTQTAFTVSEDVGEVEVCAEISESVVNGYSCVSLESQDGTAGIISSL